MAGVEGARRQQFNFTMTRPFAPKDFVQSSPERRAPGFGLKSSAEKQPLAPSGTIVTLLRKENSPARPDILSKEWLKQEVAKEREKAIPTGETPWYHLPGTGFWVKEEVAQFMRNITDAGREKFPDVVSIELAKMKKNTEAFVDEYLEQMVNLRWNLALETRNGSLKLVCPDYANVPLESVTSKKERDGAVYEMLFGEEKKGIIGIEETLAKAKPNTVIAAFSNEGWSDLQDADGKEIRYKESQIYVLKKLENGRVQAYTFRYKANIEQNEALQKSMGLTIPEADTQKDRIKNALLNYAVITPEDADQAEKEERKPVRDFADVVDLMQQAVGGREEAYEGKTFDDMRAFLKHPERFSRRHPLTERLIQRNDDYIRWRLYQGGSYDDMEKDLQIALAFNPTQLGLLYREDENVTIIDDRNGISEALAKKR